ncbi:MAG: ATP-binding protein [Bacillota bacterium]|nr:ATP-binding protein [Bacillota bacterium]
MSSLTVVAALDELDRVQDFIRNELERCNCPSEIQFQIELAVEEIFINIVNYAYHPEIGDATVFCQVEEDDPLRVIIQFLDQGRPFDPLAREDVDAHAKVMQEEVGGLGIFLVKNIMDDVSYAYENGKNVLTIIKSL